MDNTNALVLCTGSANLRAGWAHQATPSVQFPAIIARQDGATVVGEEAYAEGATNRRRPFEEGTLVDKRALIHVWHEAFRRLGCQPSRTPVMLTVSPTSPAGATADAVLTLFDRFGVPAVAVAHDAGMGLRSADRSTGVAVCIGHHVTHIAPTIEGFTLPHGYMRLDLAGDDVANYLLELLHIRGVKVRTEAGWRTVQRAKDLFCYVADDVDSEVRTFPRRFERRFSLPNGEVIVLGTERFQATEVLFKPGLLCLNRPGLAQAVMQSIERVEPSVRQQLLRNIVLFGGTAEHPGLATRLRHELTALAGGLTVQVTVQPDAGEAVWRGAASLARTASPRQWLSHKEYQRSDAASTQVTRP